MPDPPSLDLIKFVLDKRHAAPENCLSLIVDDIADNNPDDTLTSSYL